MPGTARASIPAYLDAAFDLIERVLDPDADPELENLLTIIPPNLIERQSVGPRRYAGKTIRLTLEIGCGKNNSHDQAHFLAPAIVAAKSER